MTESSETASLVSESRVMDSVYHYDKSDEACEGSDTEAETDSLNDLEEHPMRPMQTMGNLSFGYSEAGFEQNQCLNGIEDALVPQDSLSNTINPLELTYRSNITCWDDDALRADATPLEKDAEAVDEPTRPSTGSSVFERLHAE